MKVKLLNLVRSRKAIIVILILLVIIIGLTALIFINNNQAKVTEGPVVAKSNKSSVDVKTDELIVKEWGIKMPINSNLLGSVSYKMVNKNELVFTSSKLDKIDLSRAECSGITKQSWGLRRIEVGNKPNPVTKYNYLPDYLIGHIRPEKVCSEIREIYVAFSYTQQYIERF